MGTRSTRQTAAVEHAARGLGAQEAVSLRPTISSSLYRSTRCVNCVGFRDGPYYALAEKYLGGHACSLRTIGAQGGFGGGKRFRALKLIKGLVNLGDAKSLACHPASTTHGRMPAADQIKAGVKPETIRLSLGSEHVDGIIADLDQALDAAARA